MNLDFLSGIGDAIAGFFESPLVQLGLQAIGVYVVIIWLASAYWAFRDMQARTSNPVVPYLAAALIVGFTPVFFIFGIIVYRIIRPQERRGEAYERGLAEEALIAEIEQIEPPATLGEAVEDLVRATLLLADQVEQNATPRHTGRAAAGRPRGASQGAVQARSPVSAATTSASAAKCGPA